MKFTFIITNMTGGGAEKVILTLADELKQRGHAISIILLENKITHHIPADLATYFIADRISRGWIGKRWMAYKLRKRVLASKETPDLIISALPFSNEVSILANLPNHWCRIDNTLGAEISIILRKHPIKARRRLKRYRKLLNQRPLIAISDSMIKDLRNSIGITGRIEKIPNPFNFNAIRQAACKIDIEIPKIPYVIHVGRFNRQKRHDILFTAWKLLDINYILILLTPHDPKLQAMIDSFGLTDQVMIAGFKINPFPWMSSAELLVLSSDHEGLGNVLVEALLCGTRVISTDCPSGPSEILTGELARWLVPPGDPEKLAAKIKTALTLPPPNIQTVEAALAPYSTTSVINALEQLSFTSGMNSK